MLMMASVKFGGAALAANVASAGIRFYTAALVPKLISEKYLSEQRSIIPGPIFIQML